MRALLALEDGSIYSGRAFGSLEPCGGEVVFNTAMTGYQEILSDPSYHGQIVVFTTAHVGNYGIHADDSESSEPRAVGAIVREVCERPTHPLATESLPNWLSRHGAFGIEGIDTRELTLRIREKGNLRAWLTTEVEHPEAAVERARMVPPMRQVPAVENVAAPAAYDWPTPADLSVREIAPRSATADSDHGAAKPAPVTVSAGAAGNPGLSESNIPNPRVAVLDCGVKFNILRELEQRGCDVRVFPARTPFAEIESWSPDGVLLSNGPGDPEALADLVPTVQHVLRSYPTMAICLGHQLVGMALGCRILRLPFGHHGANHPVKDLLTGNVAITSQNHNYAIDTTTLPEGVTVTHVNLNDGTAQGVAHRDYRLWSLQYHPEASPGPREASVTFDRFVEALRSAVSARECRS